MNYNRIQTKGYRPLTALSNEQIMKIAPSVFAEDKHSSRSDRYSYIKSSEILVALRKEGFEPYFAQESKARNEDKYGFTKHMLRFRHRSQLGNTAVVGQEVNEVVFVNSHDGSTTTDFMGGFFRYVCSNGLLVGDSMEKVSYKHSALTLDNVIEGSYRILDDMVNVSEMKEAMKLTVLSEDSKIDLAKSARALRFKSDEPMPLLRDLLTPRRLEDKEDNLWTTYNIIQENLLRGGLRKLVNLPEANARVQTTRPIYNINDTVKINRELWNLAEVSYLDEVGVI